MKNCPEPRCSSRRSAHCRLSPWIAAAILFVLTSVGPASAASWTAYVANSGDGTVTPIDLATNIAGAPIPVGSQPAALAITPDGAAVYVADEFDGTVTPIDTATNTAGAPIAIAKAFRIAITPNGLKAYVASASGFTVTPVDLITNTAGSPINTFPVAPGPIAISPDGLTAYVFNRFGGGTDVLPISTVSDTPGARFSSGGNARSASFSPDGSTIYLSGSTAGTPLRMIDVAAQSVTFRHEFNAPWRNIPNFAISPDGATLYWGDYEYFAELDTADPFGAPMTTAFGTFNSRAVAASPDGATVYITNASDNNVLPYDTATKTLGAPIAVGSNPVAIAITPDQAPVARLSVTRAPIGSPTTFDASASTVAYGTIASYLWDFGDGTFDATATPTTTHTYTTGSHTASVIAVSSGGTSLVRVFTGQTAMKNGGLRAGATALGSLADLGAPVVGRVTPPAGIVTGGDAVQILGAGFTGATGVTFGGVAATSVVVNGDNSISATTPAGAAAGIVDVVVTNAIGVSAQTPAARFRYAGSLPAVSVPCSSASCAIQLGTPTVNVVAETDPCPVCTFKGGIEPIVIPEKCPFGGGQLTAGWLESVQNQPQGGPLSALTVSFSYMWTNSFWQDEGNDEALELVDVCFVNGTPVAVDDLRQAAPAFAGDAPPAGTILKTCEKTKGVPPCVLSKHLIEGGAQVEMLLPDSGSTFLMGTAATKAAKLKPDYGNAGESIAIRGKNMALVDSAVIGGVEAAITNRGNKEVVVTIPDGAQSGPVTLTTRTGSVSSKKPLWVGPSITKISKGGKIGGKAKIKGYNLADATDVSFNGASAEIIKAKEKVLVVTVPAGATTGPITVRTPFGMPESTTDFVVK